MGRATATTTTTQEVRIAPTVRRKILTQLNGYATVHEEMKALKGSKEGHSKAVFLLADANIDAKNFEIEGFKVSMQREIGRAHV